MNNFTKEELQEISACLQQNTRCKYNNPYQSIINKIQSMIDEYIDEQKSIRIWNEYAGYIECVKCQYWEPIE
jgi:hypothetical protein